MSESKPGNKNSKKYIAGLSVAALGVVYGDIGTSPLYAFRESFHAEYGLVPSPANVLGVLSLIFWSLILIISIKYMILILRADLEGEGGVLVLAQLITPSGKVSKKRNYLILIGLFGAALLYGDSTITPAITVLSAVEGLEVATSFFEPYIIPITIGILVALFFFQSHGTAAVGKIFGPAMIIWFTTLAVLGVNQIVQSPEVFKAINPVYAVEFFARNGLTAFLVLGSVFLVVTGGEALYADIGHFGALPIRISWFGFVLPCLLLNYFGQGALLIQNPEAVHNPFFIMVPEWALYPMVVIATSAAIIASQAVITGAFSLTRQAIQFGYSPRMKVEQTSSKESGQIYIPAVNWTLMLVTIGLVLGFQSSSNLAAAYGMAVTSTMLITTLMFAVLTYKLWKWSLALVIPFAVFFLIIDLAFFGANLHKIPDGGWFPLVVAGLIFGLMTTWKKGRAILAKRIKAHELPFETFLDNVAKHSEVKEHDVKRVKGTAVYMSSNPKATPPALLHNIKHNRVIHEDVVILSVKTINEQPYVSDEERLQVESLGNGFYRIILHYGFKQSINIPQALELANEPGLKLKPMETSYFLGSERVLPTSKGEMPAWRDRLFGIMSHNQQKATAFFGLPANRVVELGAQIRM
ncbi:MAG TPA: potassium transporter Kup [Balneolaceae bacterium]